jgi:hypothetical protein
MNPSVRVIMTADQTLARLRTQSRDSRPRVPAVASLRCFLHGRVATCRGWTKSGAPITALFLVQHDGSLRCPAIRWDHGNESFTQRTRATCAVSKTTGRWSQPSSHQPQP